MLKNHLYLFGIWSVGTAEKTKNLFKEFLEKQQKH